MALTVTFDGRPLELIKAFSAQDAREILEKRPDIAAAIVDVVMETEHALALTLWNGLGPFWEYQYSYCSPYWTTGQAPEREISPVTILMTTKKKPNSPPVKCTPSYPAYGPGEI